MVRSLKTALGFANKVPPFRGVDNRAVAFQAKGPLGP